MRREGRRLSHASNPRGATLKPWASMLSRPTPCAKRMSNVCAMSPDSDPSALRMILRKRKGHDRVCLAPDFSIAPRRDDHVLAAIGPEISHGRGLASRRQLVFPEFAARLHIER